MQTSFEQALASLKIYFGGAPADGKVALTYMEPGWKAGPRTEFYPAGNLEEIACRAVALAPHFQVYTATGVFGDAATGRGKASDVRWVGQFSLDFDVGNDGHAGAGVRPHAKEQIRDLLAAASMFPEPTLIIDTGNGLLAVWRLEDPLDTSSGEANASADQLFKAFQGELRRIAKAKFGWDLDTTSDLTRLVRIAGTFNHKTTPSKLVEIWS